MSDITRLKRSDDSELRYRNGNWNNIKYHIIFCTDAKKTLLTDRLRTLKSRITHKRKKLFLLQMHSNCKDRWLSLETNCTKCKSIIVYLHGSFSHYLPHLNSLKFIFINQSEKRAERLH